MRLSAIAIAIAVGIRIVLVTGRRLAHLAADTELTMFDAFAQAIRARYGFCT